MFGGGAGKNRNYSSWVESLFGESGDGRTMLSVCLVPLNCMVKIEIFTLCTVYHSFKAVFQGTNKEIQAVDTSLIMLKMTWPF